MAIVPVKTSMMSGYCECVCGCYELCQVRDDELDRVFCKRCSEEHLDRNKEVVAKIGKPAPPAQGYDKLPEGIKPPALKNTSTP